MSNTISLAGESFTEVVAQGLKLDRNEAEALKIKFGFKDIPENKVRSLMLPVLENILKEVKSSINYYEETFKQKLDDVYLIGGSSLLPGINQSFKDYLGREVMTVSNNTNLNLKFLSDKTKDFSLFVNVIGLGMLGASAQFKDVNLLKKMPHSEINDVDKLNLFKMGYLSRVNTIRMIFNNKYVLITMIILIGVIFAVLLQQAENFGFASAYSPGI